MVGGWEGKDSKRKRFLRTREVKEMRGQIWRAMRKRKREKNVRLLVTLRLW